MRVLLIIVLFFILSIPAIAQEPLKTTIIKEWTVDTAREEAFKDIEYNKDLSEYPAIDPNLIENVLAVSNHNKRIANRIITYYDHGDYSVIILDTGLYDKAFYYSSDGKLYMVQFFNYQKEIQTEKEYLRLLSNKKFYPIKAYKYTYPSGNLIFISIYINPDPNISFEFKPSGELIAKWIDRKGYDAKGNIIGTRK